MSHQFTYTAVRPSGEIVSGFLQAESKADLLEHLLADNLYLLRARKKSLIMMFGLQSQHDWSALERLSSTMVLLLGSKMPLVEALEVLVATSDRQLASIGQALLARISGGQSLSQASTADPAVFGRHYPLLFTVGEATGDMHAVFNEILVSVRWQRQLNARVKSLLTYPLIMLLVMSGVFLFLLLSVVPQLVSFVESVNQTLPWHTQALFAVSRVAQQNWISLCMALVGIVGCGAMLAHTSRGARRILEKLLLDVPVLGPLLTKIKMARYFYCLAMLSRSRVDLLTTLDHSKSMLHNVGLEASVLAVRDRVNAGSTLADALRESSVFPELVWRMVHIGEKSGDLSGIFHRISDLYDSDVNASINAIEQYLPPLLILLVGLMLMWMVVSIMGPLYDSVINAGVGLI